MKKQQKKIFGIWKLENFTNAYFYVETAKNLFLNAAYTTSSPKSET